MKKYIYLIVFTFTLLIRCEAVFAQDFPLIILGDDETSIFYGSTTYNGENITLSYLSDSIKMIIYDNDDIIIRKFPYGDINTNNPIIYLDRTRNLDIRSYSGIASRENRVIVSAGNFANIFTFDQNENESYRMVDTKRYGDTVYTIGLQEEFNIPHVSFKETWYFNDGVVSSIGMISSSPFDSIVSFAPDNESNIYMIVPSGLDSTSIKYFEPFPSGEFTDFIDIGGLYDDLVFINDFLILKGADIFGNESLLSINTIDGQFTDLMPTEGYNIEYISLSRNGSLVYSFTGYDEVSSDLYCVVNVVDIENQNTQQFDLVELMNSSGIFIDSIEVLDIDVDSTGNLVFIGNVLETNRSDLFKSLIVKIPVTISSTLEHINTKERFLAYPNPTGGKIRFFDETKNNIELENIVVYDVKGAIVKIQSKGSVVDLSNLRKGLYFIHSYKNHNPISFEVLKY